MGACIEVQGAEAVILGGLPLRGCEVNACELQGGAALILAALAAEGKPACRDMLLCSGDMRTYAGDLCALGADITNNTGTGEYEKFQLSKETKNK